ncbi:MAG: hypothetical protein IPH41_16070 [Sulfuritalea sp.]|jgi:hypothetical protein|nr:hypothetical protein [Sulfuritalea sp.]
MPEFPASARMNQSATNAGGLIETSTKTLDFAGNPRGRAIHARPILKQ